MYSSKRIAAPEVEPITLDQAKAQCRVEGYDDDALLGIYIQAAREHCEKQTGRAILQQTWRLTRDSFPGAFRPGHCVHPWNGFMPGTHNSIPLPRPQLLGNVVLQYFDTANHLQTLDPSLFVVNQDAEPATISPAPGAWWPFTAYRRQDAVQITYQAGYGATAAAVPASIQLACLMLVGHFYENREATQAALQGNGPMPLPLGVDALLSDETIVAFTYES